jgi:hypothetical protein
MLHALTLFFWQKLERYQNHRHRPAHGSALQFEHRWVPSLEHHRGSLHRLSCGCTSSLLEPKHQSVVELTHQNAAEFWWGEAQPIEQADREEY